MSALKQLVDAIAEQSGIDDLCKDEPDDDGISYRWINGIEIPDTITFGMIRRARAELAFNNKNPR